MNRTLTLTVVAMLAGGVASAGKSSVASKALVEQVRAFAIQPDVVYQPPVGEPSPKLGAFVERNEDGTFSTVQSKCTTKLTFKDVKSIERRSQLAEFDVGLAAKLNLQVRGVQVEASFGKKSLAGIEYNIGNKRILDGGQEEVVECCVQHPSQCEGEFVSEWWQGTGKFFRINTSQAAIKATLKELQGNGGAVDFSVSKGFNMESSWDEPMFFAYRTEKLKLQTCAEFLRDNQPDGNARFFVGVSKFKGSEQEAREDAREAAHREIAQVLGTEFVMVDGEASRVAEALISGVFGNFECVDTDTAGPSPSYLARVRYTVDRVKFDAEMAKMTSHLK
jgi:hypothetical protein